jgi:hypothetical protein
MEQEHLGVSLALGNHNHFCGWRAIITQLLLHPAFYFLKERSVALVVYNRIEREAQCALILRSQQSTARA